MAEIDLTGPETVTLLERVVTCRVEDMAPGDIRPGALLTPQGKILADFLATRTDEGVSLATHESVSSDLEKRLKLFRLRANVDITTKIAPARRFDNQERIASHRPALSLDYAANTVFPTDINLDIFGGVDYKKGCFVGQEVVSRMKRRGTIRKRSLHVSGDGLAPGTPIIAGEQTLGDVTSVDAGEALARLRTDHLAKALEAGLDLRGGGKVVQLHLPSWLRDEWSSQGDKA